MAPAEVPVMMRERVGLLHRCAIAALPPDVGHACLQHAHLVGGPGAAAGQHEATAPKALKRSGANAATTAVMAPATKKLTHQGERSRIANSELSAIFSFTGLLVDAGAARAPTAHIVVARQ
jgi:hypothetical protein